MKRKVIDRSRVVKQDSPRRCVYYLLGGEEKRTMHFFIFWMFRKKKEKSRNEKIKNC